MATGLAFGVRIRQCICALREEHRLRVFENRMLRRIFGPKRDEVTGEGENCIMRSFVICTLHEV
jgi:hypothetical protein